MVFKISEEELDTFLHEKSWTKGFRAISSRKGIEGIEESLAGTTEEYELELLENSYKLQFRKGWGNM